MLEQLKSLSKKIVRDLCAVCFAQLLTHQFSKSQGKASDLEKGYASSEAVCKQSSLRCLQAG